ncbi:unnamed protein product [Ectocarpus sp. 4 AP-2014]
MASEDRAALVALFRSTGGKIRWNRKMNWDKNADLSRWYGVEVNDDGRVVELRLPRNNILGMLGLPKFSEDACCCHCGVPCLRPEIVQPQVVHGIESADSKNITVDAQEMDCVHLRFGR